MVSLSPNPPQPFHFFDPINMEDPNKKIRKPYTITKSRENWTNQEHDKFLEALHLFDRDWKKIEAFVRSKTVIQIRSHAQKYFLKVQKNSTSEHVPPPRPKRKAAYPCPQKASKNGLDDAVLTKQTVPLNYCYSSSNESTPRAQASSKQTDRADQGKPIKVMPNFAQVYSFIGSVFDPSAINHLQTLKLMDPINVETVLLLLRNLSANLMNPEFESDRRLLSSYNANLEKAKSSNHCSQSLTDKSESAILSA